MACELLDGPFEGVMFRDVDSTAGGRVKGGTFNVFWYWDIDINIIGNAFLLVVAFDLDDEANAGIGGRFHDDIHCEERFHSNIQPVAHEFELAVGGDESDQSLVFEPAQSDALMELDIVELNGLVLGGASLSLVVSLIVETQFEIGHA